MQNSRVSYVLLMILCAVGSRLLPHPPNFAPVLAISLFAGAFLPKAWQAVLVSLLSMVVSDAFLGFHDLAFIVYGCMAFVVFLGRFVQENPYQMKTLGFGFAGSVFFFVVTNIFVWLTSGMYPVTGEGLVACFTMALPFFQNSLLGDLFYGAILFGSMYFLNRSTLIPIPVKVSR